MRFFYFINMYTDSKIQNMSREKINFACKQNETIPLPNNLNYIALSYFVQHYNSLNWTSTQK